MRRPLRPVAELDSSFPALKAQVIARTGHHYYADKDDLLFDRLRKRFKARGLADSAAYLATLTDAGTGPAEWAALEDEITIGETFFFRYAEQFAALRGTILPGLIAARAQERRLRIWSAGCSTGAEPYSLAILLHELLGDALPDWRISITGTDISVEALATARAAVFGRWALRTLPPEDHARYFVLGPSVPGIAREGSFTLRPEFRRMVQFERQNLMSLADGSVPPHAVEYDLILCRNVLIYFQADAVLAIVRGLGRRLVPDGWLLIGHAEPNPAFAGTLTPVNLPGTVAYRPMSAGAMPELAAAPPPARAWMSQPASSPQPGSTSQLASTSPLAWEPLPVPVAASSDAFRPVPPETPGPPDFFAAEANGAIRESSIQDAAETVAAIRALADAGETGAAWHKVRAALLVSPTDPRLHYYDGLLARSLGRDAEAERAFRGALYLDRDFVMAHYQLGLLLIAVGRQDAAERVLANTLRLSLAVAPGSLVAEGDGLTAGQLAQSAGIARNGMRTGSP